MKPTKMHVDPSRCAQLFVYSTGGTYSPPTVSIPGYVKATDPGVHFDYWNNMHPTNYQTPGPSVVISPQTSNPSKPQIVPFNKGYSECLVSNGNWCGVSVPSFKSEDECYSVSHPLAPMRTQETDEPTSRPRSAGTKLMYAIKPHRPPAIRAAPLMKRSVPLTRIIVTSVGAVAVAHFQPTPPPQKPSQTIKATSLHIQCLSFWALFVKRVLRWDFPQYLVG